MLEIMLQSVSYKILLSHPCHPTSWRVGQPWTPEKPETMILAPCPQSQSLLTKENLVQAFTDPKTSCTAIPLHNYQNSLEHSTKTPPANGSLSHQKNRPNQTVQVCGLGLLQSCNLRNKVEKGRLSFFRYAGIGHLVVLQRRIRI